MSLVRWTPRRPSRSVARFSCELVRERDFRLVGARTLNLSESGALVALAPGARVLTGESVLLSFKSPLSNAWIDAEAVVARVIHGRRPTDGGGALGLSFESLADDLRARLKKDLSWLPAVRPARVMRS